MFDYRGSTASVTAAALLALVLSAFVGAGAEGAEHLIRPTTFLCRDAVFLACQNRGNSTNP
jgi:hypothetical protein